MLLLNTPSLVEPISNSIDSWVNQEMFVSTHDRNQYLDDFDSVRIQTGLPLDDPANFYTIKHYSHWSRQHLWGEVMVEYPEDDYLTARHIFNSLMQISGNVKRICHVSASDARDYSYKKLNDLYTGKVTMQAVSDSLQSYITVEGKIKTPSAKEANDIALATFEQNVETLDFVRERSPNDFGHIESPTVEKLRLSQKKWIHVATSGIIMAMGYRKGDLKLVPLLEAKSISDEPALIYPFKLGA